MLLKKILRSAAALILILLPFYPITENFFPSERQVNNQIFSTYIFICLTIILFGIVLIFLLKKNGKVWGWLFFGIGLVAMIPLHLGPPRIDATLLTDPGIERFRYGMLMLAILLLFLGGYSILSPVKTLRSKLFLFILIATALLNVWDNYSSFMLSGDMKSWTESGKNANDFSAQFDFHIAWRTAARISLYITAMVLIFELAKKAEIKKWQFVILNIVCLAGIVFCVLCLMSGFQDFYFPFMVPAIALAPVYWAGIASLTYGNAYEKTGNLLYSTPVMQ